MKDKFLNWYPTLFKFLLFSTNQNINNSLFLFLVKFPNTQKHPIPISFIHSFTHQHTNSLSSSWSLSFCCINRRRSKRRRKNLSILRKTSHDRRPSKLSPSLKEHVVMVVKTTTTKKTTTWNGLRHLRNICICNWQTFVNSIIEQEQEDKQNCNT